MAEVTVKEYKGVKYIIEPFKGGKGLKLKFKVVRLLVPVLESLKALQGEANGDEDNFLALIGEALQHVLESNTDDEMFTLLEELMTGVKKENGAINFDTEFTKNYSTLYKLAKDVIMENYEDVFQELGMNVV